MQYNAIYLLNSSESTKFGVFEMGLRKPGDLARSCKYLKPQIRILLNIGIDHLEECHTLEGYIKAKSEILEGMDPLKDILILNADDENTKKLDISKYKRVLYFGFRENVHFQAKDTWQSINGTSFLLKCYGGYYPVFVPCYGRNNVYNALAAIAAVCSVGMDVVEVCKNLATFKNLERHLEFRRGTGGLLGSIGEKSKMIGISALEGRMDKNSVCFSKNGSDICEILKPFLNENTVILVKVDFDELLTKPFLQSYMVKFWMTGKGNKFMSICCASCL